MPRPETEPRRPEWRTYLAAYARVVDRFRADPTPANFALLQAGEEILARELQRPGKVALGHTVATPGAVQALHAGLHIPPEFLLRHVHGDWGDLDAADRRANDEALARGGRLLSAYATRRHERLWVITEWDRSATTILTPDEY